MAGTYAVASELSRRGWLVAPTYGNAPIIDLFAQRNGTTVTLQVKTTTIPSIGWQLNQRKIAPDVIYVFVAMRSRKLARYFLLKGSEVPQFCDNHPTRNAVRLPKAQLARFENRWGILDGREGDDDAHYL